MNPQFLGYGLAATTGLCWAILAILLKYALTFSDSGTIVWVRMMVAASLTLGYLLITQKEKAFEILKKPPLICLLAGFGLAFNYLGYMKGIELTSAKNTQVVIQLGPVMLLFAGVIYFKEIIKPLQWLGIGVAFCGLLLFNWDPLIANFQEQGHYLVGNLWVVTAAFTWVVFACVQKILLARGWTPAQTNLVVYLVCAFVLFFVSTPATLLGMSLSQLFLLFILGVNTLIAYGALVEAMRLIPASKVSLIITCNPLLTILMMDLMVFYGLDFITAEPLHWRGYLGALLVVAGVVIAVSLKSKART